MWYTHRQYQENTEDFKSLCRFVSELNRKQICDWSIGRLCSWQFGKWSEESQNPELFPKQAELFYNYFGQLCGLVITEDFGENYYLLSEGNEFVIQQMVEFLAEGGNFNRPYVVCVSENDTYRIKILEKNGFSYSYDGDTTFVYPAEKVCFPEVLIPEGFTMTSQKEFTDAHRVELMRFYAFNPESTYDEIMDYAYKYARKNPLLMEADSIVLLNENGEPVSGCVGYLDRENLTMEVEVVATKKEYENRGFAKAVISECMKRAMEMGMKELSISGWNEQTRKLYSSFGECKVVNKVNYVNKSEVKE